MLRGKYKKYNKLYLYAFDGTNSELHFIKDEDFIGYWEEEDLSVIFFHQPKDSLIEKILDRYGLKLETKACINYEEWGEGRKIRPFSIGPYKFAPVWEEIPEALLFDPGVVFGSGQHPTTFLCLEALWELWKDKGPFSKIADLGCGSGLISLLAARLGSQVLAVDLNPLCIELTKKNLSLNHLASQALVLKEDVKRLLPYQAPLIVANLYKGLLLEMFGLPSFWKNQYYILSGFVTSMEKEIRDHLRSYASVIHRKEKEGWVVYIVKAKNKEETCF